MKTTVLNATHRSLGAKMVPFAGFEMPVSYSGLNDEHFTVRQSVGVFDVSHMGEFILRGPHALQLIQQVCSNDASVLSPGKAQYTCMPNAQGGIVDDLIVYALDAQTYMLVVNAGNIKKDWDWIYSQNQWHVTMEDISDKTALLAVQGPKAKTLIQRLTSVRLDEIAYYNFTKGKVAGIDNVLISHTGYTGAGGFELYVDNAHAQHLWDALFEYGTDLDIKPIGLGARDTLRLEMGFCLYGNDINDTTSPLEAGLGWITKFTKPFTASELLVQQKTEGLKRKLIGFEMTERGIPRHGYAITDNQGRIIGEVTSGTQSPSLQKAIGMGYVETSSAVLGSECCILIRNQPVKAKVVKIPFYKTTN